MKTKVTRLVADIREDLHKEIKIAAIREGMTVKDIIEKCLMNYLSNKNKHQAKAA